MKREVATRQFARADNVKGTAAYRSDALRHGQRPEMWPFVSI